MLENKQFVGIPLNLQFFGEGGSDDKAGAEGGDKPADGFDAKADVKTPADDAAKADLEADKKGTELTPEQEAAKKKADEDAKAAQKDILAKAQELADAMVAKKLKDMPTKEEVKAFKEWQASQQTVEERAAKAIEEANAKATEANEQLESFKRRDAIRLANIDEQFVQFVEYSVMSTAKAKDITFEHALSEFMVENMDKYKKTEVRQVKVDTDDKKKDNPPKDLFLQGFDDEPQKPRKNT